MNYFKSKNLKRIILVLLMGVLMLSVAGCGLVGAGKEDDKSTAADNSPDRIVGNKLIATGEDELLSIMRDVNDDDNDGFTEDWILIGKDPNLLTFLVTRGSMMWFTELDASQDTLDEIGWTGPLKGTVIRDVSIFMYNSIFPNKKIGFTTELVAGGGTGYLPTPGVLGTQTSQAPQEEEVYSPDAFMAQQQWLTFNVEPVSLIQKVNDAMATELASDNSALSQLTDAIEVLAAGILITIWAMGFISQIVNEKFSMETLLKTLMQLLCGIVIIKNADTFVWAFTNAGNALVDVMSPDKNPIGFDDFAEELKGYINSITTLNVGFSLGFINQGLFTIWFELGSIGAILLMLLPFGMMLKCAYTIISQMVMRTFELVVRITLAPIPLAFSAQNGFSHESIRYFRQILACAMQPVLMIIGAVSTHMIASAVMTIFGYDQNEVTGFVASLAMGFVYLIFSAYLGETKHLARDVIAGH